MGWDGSGNVNRTNGTNSGTTVWQDDRDDGVNIRADRHDTHDEDLANALENTVALDGQTTTTTDNSLLWYNGTNNRFEGFSVAASRLIGRKATGDVGAVTAEEGQRVLGDDEHATDSGTDAYVSATTTAAPAAGVRIYRDFQSPNTTTTPTLDALTITTKDGSALWAGALFGVHTLQLTSGGGSWLVLDPNPLDGDQPASVSYVDDTDPFSTKLLHVQDQKTSGTSGGDFNNGAWRTRDLNTVLTNKITDASLASNRITLPAGTYYIEASAPAATVDRHATRLRDTTGSADLLSGTSEYSSNANTMQQRSFVTGRFTVSVESVIELQHRCETTKTSNGLGLESGSAFTVDEEVYSDVRIWKVG